MSQNISDCINTLQELLIEFKKVENLKTINNDLLLEINKLKDNKSLYYDKYSELLKFLSDNVNELEVHDSDIQYMYSLINNNTINKNKIKIMAFLYVQAKKTNRSYFINANKEVNDQFESFIGNRFNINYKSLLECLYS